MDWDWDGSMGLASGTASKRVTGEGRMESLRNPPYPFAAKHCKFVSNSQYYNSTRGRRKTAERVRADAYSWSSTSLQSET